MTIHKTRAQAVERADRLGGILISVIWDSEHKRWVVQGSWHKGTAVRVVTNYVDATGAPSVDDLRALMTAVESEVQSWLW